MDLTPRGKKINWYVDRAEEGKTARESTKGLSGIAANPVAVCLTASSC
jgi:hypothetical protein